MVFLMSKGIALLAIIAFAQLIAILLMYTKIGVVEADLAAVISTQETEEYRNSPANPPDDHLTEDRMRQIMREELAARFTHQTGPAEPGDPVSAAGPRDPMEVERQREQVFQQLEYFKSIGHISDIEMQRLQTDIAKLDSVGRSEALRELSRAINSGGLEARL